MTSASWDRRSLNDQRRAQGALLRQTILHMALGGVPFVRARLAVAGIDARLVRGPEDLSRVPASMRGDVLDPERNPDGPRALVLEGDEEDVKRFTDRSVLWSVARARLVGGQDAQRRAVESACRPVHVHSAPGPGGAIPVSYTRDDLDLLARAGARLAAVLGLERKDRLLNLVPFGATLEFWGIFYMAHGYAMEAVHPRRRAGDIAASLAAFAGGRPTAIAVPAEEAARVPALAREAGIDLAELRAVIAVGRSLTASERAAVLEGLAEAGAGGAYVVSAYGPAEGRVLWGECAVPPGHAETFGFHTYPDLDLVEVFAPDTGAPVGSETAGEIVVTPLGFRGGGAPRWRTGDLALGGVTKSRCPNCGRTVPRIGPAVRRSAWLRTLALNGTRAEVDLREVGAAVAGRAREWQVEVVGVNGRHEMFVYCAADSGDAVVDLFEDLERRGAAPSQIVLATDEELRARHLAASGTWPRLWERASA